MNQRRSVLRSSSYGTLFPVALTLLLAPGVARAASGIVFHDIAAGDGAGISYRRAASTTQAAYDALKLLPLNDLRTILATPMKAHGQPGIALLDYDRDGDLDIYVTNGPGRANSLYQNQRKQTGQTTFIDQGAAAGVGANDMDSTGVCFGDIDNDGDEDLYVLGRMEANRLFRNNGNGSFTNITATAGVGAGVFGHTSCSMGDINGDGKLDIFVANTFDWTRIEAIVTDLFGYNHPNQLFLNAGGNTFTDVSQTSGIRVLGGIPAPDKNSTITWAVAMVDYDLDGDTDIIHGDDHGGMPPSQFAGVDRGFLQIFNNDGTGHFTNMTALSGTAFVSEQWMGLAFGDVNCDGFMDMFGTSVGDYMYPQLVGAPTPVGLSSSIWHYGLPGGAFLRGDFALGDLGKLGATPFGWGTGMADYDNDGFTDIVYYGNLDLGIMIQADNPGVVLHNEGGTGAMVWDQAATASSADRVSRSETHGVALGDLNDDGFVDITHVAAEFAGPNIPLVPPFNLRNSPFDAVARYIPMYTVIGPDFESEWGGYNMDDGMLGVEINSANNGNHFVKVRVRGSVGNLPEGKANRDGIGAVVFFTPAGGKQVMAPVLGGSSHASQHDLAQIFGLGQAVGGTLEVLWQGGVRNRLYSVMAGERVTMPEIPCSFSANWPSFNAYKKCVNKALSGLKSAGFITNNQKKRLNDSALEAYEDTH